MLQKNNIRGQRGYSLATWAAVFTAVVAASFLIRVPVQQALEGKIVSVTDYMFWTKWDPKALPDQYKGENYTFSKTEASQNVNTRQSEKNKYIKYNVTSTVNEGTISSSVEDGSQPLLRTFDLNALTSVTPGPPVEESEEEETIEQINCSELSTAAQVCYSDGEGGCECKWVGVGGKL